MLSLCYFHVTTLILLIMVENINKGKNVAKEYLVVFPGGYSHIVWVGVCRWIRESPTLY